LYALEDNIIFRAERPNAPISVDVTHMKPELAEARKLETFLETGQTGTYGLKGAISRPETLGRHHGDARNRNVD
jgi:hypothetical protein